MASRIQPGANLGSEERALSQSQEPASTVYHSQPQSSRPVPAGLRAPDTEQQTEHDGYQCTAEQESEAAVSPQNVLAPTLNPHSPTRQMATTIDPDVKTRIEAEEAKQYT